MRVCLDPVHTFEPNVGERLPFVPYSAWSWNLRYELRWSRACGATRRLTGPPRATWGRTACRGSTTAFRALQTGIQYSEIYARRNPEGGHWLTAFYSTNLTDTNAMSHQPGNFALRPDDRRAARHRHAHQLPLTDKEDNGIAPRAAWSHNVSPECATSVRLALLTHGEIKMIRLTAGAHGHSDAARAARRSCATALGGYRIACGSNWRNARRLKYARRGDIHDAHAVCSRSSARARRRTSRS